MVMVVVLGVVEDEAWVLPVSPWPSRMVVGHRTKYSRSNSRQQPARPISPVGPTSRSVPRQSVPSSWWNSRNRNKDRSRINESTIGQL